MEKRVLLGHLNSNGDCLFATVIARQIKEVDYPGCHLTWAVSTKCKQTIVLNPYVDEIWEIPVEKSLVSLKEWNSFVTEAARRRENGEFDEVFLTQIAGDNWFRYDGGIRSSIHNNYPFKITAPLQATIQLSDSEVENVAAFAAKHKLAEYKQVILVECGADSFETALNPRSALGLANDIVANNTGTAVILSSNKTIETTSDAVIDASVLSFRENAEITKYCDLFIGCGSGISWLTTTDWAKKLEMIMVIDQGQNVFPSMIFDHEYFNLPTGHIIEIKSDKRSIGKLKVCLEKISTDGFAAAKSSFHEQLKPGNFLFLSYQVESTLGRLNFRGFFASMKRIIRRNGKSLLLPATIFRIVRVLLSRFSYRIRELAGSVDPEQP
ncbi:hypothetical protein BH10ACI2_BH10ACI2_03770 [soil metagenome]